MIARPPALLVVTGLQREAQVAAGDGVVTLCGGGRPDLLRHRMDDVFSDQNRAIRGILSFGLCGGLAPHLKPGDIGLATLVIANTAHHRVPIDWQDAIAARLGGAVRLHRGAFAGVDTVVSKSADKAALHALNSAIAVDMESHVAAEFAERHRLPFAVIRAVSDPATRSLPDLASSALTPDGGVAIGKVMGGLLRKPHHLPALVAAGIDSERAFASLRRCRRLLGPLFGLGRAYFR